MTAISEFLPPEQQRQVQTAATRLADTLARPSGSVGLPERSQSLSKGATGIAVLHGARAQAGIGSWHRVHQWLTAAASEDLHIGPGTGLWHGAPAVAFALSTAAPPGHYPNAIERLDDAVITLTRTRLDAAGARISAGKTPSRSEFDLVRGLTGLGAYLLRRAPHSQLVRRVLSYLVHLTEPLPADDPTVGLTPGWWTSDIPSGRSAAVFSGGHADLGMAHGIAGPLALLSTAMRAGVTVDDHATAIDRICQWLDIWRQDSPHGPWWPKRVTLAELHAGRSWHTGPGRPSWCYGTPGIARAQQLAGAAADDRARQRRAEQALLACVTDPGQLAQLTDLSLCHGWTGLIATFSCAAVDALTPDLSAQLPHLTAALLAKLQTFPRSPMRPGLIDGIAGIAITLHTITTTKSNGWETSLLIN